MVYTKKERQDIINDIMVDIVTNVTAINDLNPGSVIRTLIEAIGQQIYEQYLQLENIYKGTKIDTATGEDLNNLGVIVGAERHPGEVATGKVTFRKYDYITTDFVIPENSVVSTPQELTEIYEYKTTSDRTFANEINHNFVFYNGVNKYPLNERFVRQMGHLHGTQGGSGNTWTYPGWPGWTIDYAANLYIVTDLNGLEEIDDCEATTDWVAATDSTIPALESTVRIKSDNSIQLGKDGTTQDFMRYHKEFATPFDIENKLLFLNIFLVDSATQNKFENWKIKIGSTAGDFNNNYFETNYWSGTVPFDRWFQMVINPKLTGSGIGASKKVGAPNIKEIRWVQITGELYSTTETVTSGDVLLDFIYAAEGKRYSDANIISFNDPTDYPDHDTTINTWWNPATIDIDCEATEVGSNHNVSRAQIIYKVTSLPETQSVINYTTMTGGLDEEDDDTLRERIKNMSAGPGKATASALENALMNIEGISSVAIFDLPVKDIENEPHIYNDNVDIYKLSNEVAFLDDDTTPTNILITDTYDGSADYTYDTDYFLNIDNQVEWISGGTPPTSTGDIFYVNYQINHLGHTEVLIAGEFLPLSTDIKNEIEDVIEETRALGVSVTWEEPALVYFNIDCEVEVDIESGYSTDIVKTNVYYAIIKWLNTFEINEDVKVSKFYQVAHNVDGVLDVSITDWNGDTSPPFDDYAVTSKEIIKAGTINVS